jgi:adenylate kinase
VLLGPPGAGKGTQAVWMHGEFGIPHISTGDILRDQASRGTALGLEAKRYMDEGDLVPDAIVVEMVIARLRESDAAQGFILDGYPRTLEQAQALDRALTEGGIELTAVLDMVVDRSVILERLKARVQCAGCKTPYNLVTSPPKAAGVCDKCGGELIPRNDDKDAKIRRRLEEFATAIDGLRAFYSSKGILREVDAVGTPEEVEQKVRQAIAG